MKKLIENRAAIFSALSFILSIASMAIVFTLLGRVLADDMTSASIFLGFALLCEAAYNLILFFKYDDKKDRLRISVVAILFVFSAIMGFIKDDESYTFFLISSFAFFISLAINRLLFLSKGKKAKLNVTNALLAGLYILFSTVVFTPATYEEYKGLVVIVAFILLFMSFKKLILPSFKLDKVKVLFNILNVTHTLDVLICLLALMIAFSFIFPMVEPNITNFWDGLWYSFAVITTIGFGDFVAQTAVGRILTVILGLYGIVIVAIITSVIVNFYNAISDKTSEKQVNKIVQDVIDSKENDSEKPKETKKTIRKKTK